MSLPSFCQPDSDPQTLVAAGDFACVADAPSGGLIFCEIVSSDRRGVEVAYGDVVRRVDSPGLAAQPAASFHPGVRALAGRLYPDALALFDALSPFVRRPAAGETGGAL